MFLNTAQVSSSGIVSTESIRIYTGILGQIGDIIMFTATIRRLKALFPNSQITFAVSAKYREAGELVVGLPYVDRLFVTHNYFEKQTHSLGVLRELGWPVDLRGDDEVEEQRRHDLVLETRPSHRRWPWWEYDHQVAECAHMVGVPGPIDIRTEIALPPRISLPIGSEGKVVIHNDPAISPDKAWAWTALQEFVYGIEAGQVVLLGHPGPSITGVMDLRGRTTLAQAAAIIAVARCYIGIDSGLMWIAGSLQVPTVGLYGTRYVPAYQAIYPQNPQALYLQVEGSPTAIAPEAVYNAYEQVRR